MARHEKAGRTQMSPSLLIEISVVDTLILVGIAIYLIKRKT